MEEYMVIEGFGVTLRRLTHDKIEMLRQWRNDPKIRQYMFYREEITPEMQERWFANLDKTRNFYFIIVYHEKEVGCINIKDVDFEKKCGEPGIFIFDDEFINSDVAIRASFALGPFIWKELDLNYQYIHIVKSNVRAIKYNSMFGYKLAPGYENSEKPMYILTKEDALTPNKFRDRLMKLLLKTI